MTLNQGVTKNVILDALGRPEELFVNGQLFALVAYDALGRVDTLSLSDGSILANDYDPGTLAQVGFHRLTPDGKSYASSFQFNSRGLIGSETQESPAGAIARTYSYSPERYLYTSTDAQHAYTYGFDPGTGLATSMQTDSATSAFKTSGSTLTAGNQTYGFDTLGRVTQRNGALAYVYDPDGQIGHANIAGGIDYLYDESGQRLAKTKSGQTTIYAGAGVLDATGLTEPISIAGVHLGTLHKGNFAPLSTDVRGTVLGAPAGSGTSDVASPFGVRTTQPDASFVTDYAEQPRDADLGAVRMGVRDYDPQTGRFLQPDGLYLGDPSRCIGSNAMCNLYSYAGNNPVSFVDPSGQLFGIDDLIVGAIAAGIVALVTWITTGGEGINLVVGGSLGGDSGFSPAASSGSTSVSVQSNAGAAPGISASPQLGAPSYQDAFAQGLALGTPRLAVPRWGASPAEVRQTQVSNSMYRMNFLMGGIVALGAAVGGGAELGGGADIAAETRGAMSLPAEETWGNPATLGRHLSDHGADFGVIDASQYSDLASQFLQDSQLRDLPTKIDAGGIIRVYDPQTNIFGAYNPNGTTRTFYKLNPQIHGLPSNIEYWNAQPGTTP
jgi:RHS repeat-associated protein